MNQDLKDVYLNWICSLNSQATIHRYKVALNRFSTSIWSRKVYEVEIAEWESITPQIVSESFLEPIKETGVKLSTISGYFSAVRSYLTFLNQSELVQEQQVDLAKFEFKYYELLPSKKELESRLIGIERELSEIRGMLEKYRN
ncbi:site-specific integrase [Limosilactobacillus vaginalis]|uniref:site-specific integrase n=1 Tax=Limosilactobacillus vaginalis TaxID=1633 RepID=UPI003F27390E